MNTIDWKAYLCLVIICVVWGTTYLVLRVGVTLVPPFLFTGIRQSIAGMMLCMGTVFIYKNRLPDFFTLMKHAVVGFFMITIGNGAVGWAEMYVSSGIAAVICSLMPIWIILINVFFRTDDTIDLTVISGIIMGMFGLLLIFRDNLADFTNTNYTLGIIVIFLATISWASGTLYLRSFKKNGTPVLDAGLQMLFGGIFLLMISSLTENPQNAVWNRDSLFALCYLIVFGSAIAYGAYSYVLTRLPTPIVSLYAYINPVVAILLGWLILNEKLTVSILLGCLVIVSGVYTVNTGYRKQELKRRCLV